MAKTEKNKKDVVTTEDMNKLMDTYRNSVLPTPVLLWRTEGKTVAAWELSEDDLAAIETVVTLPGKDDK